MARSTTARCAARLLVVALAVALQRAPDAGTVEQLRVSAVVRAVLRVQVDPVLALEVSERDLRRGYVEPPLPLRVEIVTNGADPPQLLLGPGAPMVQEVVALLAGDAGPPRHASQLQVPVPGKGLRRTELNLRLRLYLSQDAVAGAYRWPVRVSVLPQ